ncbi:phage tail protein [Pseudomonas fluorescens]|uniref:Phage tail protein n=1 Tax=Pseudomonas fluorescens TaxID=294 RepID=A0A944HER8_PSEFL|nr:phage tail protein [Pseudomonas fluorescens]MBT2295484.1 phage tail protein [Pseudomonas fluorescens]MBT2308836.1 phage tail protein [Pseudomonas fluorescens]MBT2312411.1 phage tail protein [Pseudomonas fluorescens]MBT2318022.1 phage tail protein [Pseudomonas fluorescens]MBT2330912.1 phage tail protein [Pseudomonas fluorescens]
MDYPKSVPSAGLVNGKFVDENPLTGTPGSLIPAAWGNGVTQEIVNVIKAGDLTPDETDNDQLLQAIQSVTAKGWNQDLALPLAALPLPTIATADARLPITPAAVSTSGGRVSIPAGVYISIAQEVVSGRLGRSRTFVTSAWSSTDLLPSSGYFLRAQVTGDSLTFYMQHGSLYDVAPESLKGTINGASGGGFQSTPLDMCLAWVLTGAPGSLPVVRSIYNRSRLSWTQTVNGTGVVYLPLDPHARAGRLVSGNPTPSSSAVTSLAFAQAGWVGGNYSYLNPASTTIVNQPNGWTNPASPGMCVLSSNNVVNDVMVSTITASFDHSQLRSLWQSYQAEHTLGATNADSDELLLSMGIKGHQALTDYSVGIAVNFTNAINVHLSWELIR